uniref:Putative glycoprotein n=1 Tax=Shahe isopoda virus 4 TaxID=1923424 RepID=A0A1L3KPJ3_9VIRU|nr:putative glycoprotein [Shahe isopoda virus 4]APG79316.1 putative glycoprotein [Shahe isopoda virus 4]
MIIESFSRKGLVLNSTAFNSFILSFGVCVAYTIAVSKVQGRMLKMLIPLVWLVLLGGSVGGEVIEYQGEQLTRLEYMEGESGYYKEGVSETGIEQQCDANNCLVSGENDISWDMITGSRLNTIVKGPSTVTGEMTISIRILNLTVSRGFIPEYVQPEIRLGVGFGDTIDGSDGYDMIKNHYREQTEWYESNGARIDNFKLEDFDWDKTWKRVSEYSTKNLNDIRECGSWTDNNLYFAAIHAVIPQFKGISVGHFDEDDLNDGLFGVTINGGAEQLVKYIDLVIGADVGNGVTLKLYQEPTLYGPSGRGCLFYQLNGPYVDFYHAGYCNPPGLGTPSESGIGMVQTAYVPNSESLTPTTIFYGRNIPQEVIWQRGSNPQETGTTSPTSTKFLSYKEYQQMTTGTGKIFGFLAAWGLKKVIKTGIVLLAVGASTTTAALWADAKDEWCEAVMYAEGTIDNLIETVTSFNVTEGEKQFSMSKSTTINNNQFAGIRGRYENVRGTGILKVICDQCSLEIREGVVEIAELVVSECEIFQTTGSGSCKITVNSIGTGGNIPLTSDATLLESFMYVETGSTSKILGVLVTTVSSIDITICSGSTCDTAPLKYNFGSDGGSGNTLNPSPVKPQWTGNFNDLCTSNGLFCFTYSLVCVASIIIAVLTFYSIYRLLRDRAKIKFGGSWSSNSTSMMAVVIYIMFMLNKSVGAAYTWADGDTWCGEPTLTNLMGKAINHFNWNQCVLESDTIPDTIGVMYGVAGDLMYSDSASCITASNKRNLTLCNFEVGKGFECKEEFVSVGWCFEFGFINGSFCYVKEYLGNFTKGLGETQAEGRWVYECSECASDIFRFNTSTTKIGGCTGITSQASNLAHKSEWPVIYRGIYLQPPGDYQRNVVRLRTDNNMFEYHGLGNCEIAEFTVFGVTGIDIRNGTFATVEGNRLLVPNTASRKTVQWAIKAAFPEGARMLTQERAFYSRDRGVGIITEHIVGLCIDKDNTYKFMCVKERTFRWGDILEISGYRRVKKDNTNILFVYSVVGTSEAVNLEQEICNMFDQKVVGGAFLSRVGKTWWTITCMAKGVSLCEYKDYATGCSSESRVRMNVGGAKEDMRRDEIVQRSMKKTGRSNVEGYYNFTNSMYYRGMLYEVSMGGPICLECVGLDPIYGGRCNGTIAEVWINNLPTFYENTLYGTAIKVADRQCFGINLGGVKCESKLTDKAGFITPVSGCAIVSQDSWKSFKIVKAGEDARLKEGTVSYWYKGRLENDMVKVSDPNYCWGGMTVNECWNCVYHEFSMEFWVPIGLAIAFVSIFLACFIYGSLRANWLKRTYKNAKEGVGYLQNRVQSSLEWLSGKVGQELYDVAEDMKRTVEGLPQDKAKQIGRSFVNDVQNSLSFYENTLRHIRMNKEGDPSRAKRELAESIRRFTSVMISYRSSQVGRKIDKIALEFGRKYGEKGEIIKEKLVELNSQLNDVKDE